MIDNMSSWYWNTNGALVNVASAALGDACDSGAVAGLTMEVEAIVGSMSNFKLSANC